MEFHSNAIEEPVLVSQTFQILIKDYQGKTFFKYIFTSTD